MNKECEKAALYFYGEMTRREADAFKAHAAACPRCREELAFLEQTQEALVPPAASDKAVEKVLAQAASAQIPALRWRWLKSVFAALLLAVCGVWYFMTEPGGTAAQEQGQSWLAYVSEDADREYTDFAAEFEEFENQF